ncbi:MAG: cohesin domain-containing protein, partial [Chloroflexota bacterium]
DMQNDSGTGTITSVNVGETATVTVSLNNVPATGYTSAEFTCTYDPALLEDSNIVVGSLFGVDAAVAINDAHNGSFIVAIAGSSGNKATTSGPVFTFTVKGLQAGLASIECTARVSKGDNVLTSIPSTGAASLTVVGVAATPTFTATPDGSATATSTPDGSATATSTPNGSATVTSTPDGSATATSTPDGSATATSTPDGSATATPDGSATTTPAESPTPTFTFTPDVSPTPTFTFTPEASPTPLPVGAVNGQVNASKAVTISLYNADSSLAATTNANPDGTFNLEAIPGTYTIVATVAGFLSAQGSVTITSGAASTMPTISLLAGDIDNNNVIDQFDAMTIGMSYNAADPVSADLNNDGVINVLDLELLAQNYRQTGPTAWQ